MTDKKPCAMEARGEVAVTFTPKEAKLFAIALKIATDELGSVLYEAEEKGDNNVMAKVFSTTAVVMRVLNEIESPCVGCDAKKVGEGDVVKKIDIN